MLSALSPPSLATSLNVTGLTVWPPVDCGAEYFSIPACFMSGYADVLRFLKLFRRFVPYARNCNQE